jgi:hypothetical protein
MNPDPVTAEFRPQRSLFKQKSRAKLLILHKAVLQPSTEKRLFRPSRGPIEVGRQRVKRIGEAFTPIKSRTSPTNIGSFDRLKVWRRRAVNRLPHTSSRLWPAKKPVLHSRYRVDRPARRRVTPSRPTADSGSYRFGRTLIAHIAVNTSICGRATDSIFMMLRDACNGLGSWRHRASEESFQQVRVQRLVASTCEGARQNCRAHVLVYGHSDYQSDQRFQRKLAVIRYQRTISSWQKP